MASLKKRMDRVLWKLYLCIGVIVFSVSAGILSYYGVLDRIDYIVSDAIYQSIRSSINESRIKIIAIDEATIEQYGEYSEWSRSITAQLIEKLNTAEQNAPKVIAFNLSYYGEKDSEGDNELTEVCSKYKNICMSASAETERKVFEYNNIMPSLNGDIKNPKENSSLLPVSEKDTTTVPEPNRNVIKQIENEKVTNILFPYDELLQYVTTGIINTTRSSEDGYVRGTMASINFEGVEIDSFAVSIYKLYMESIGKEYIMPKLDEENAFAFNFSNRSEDYTVYSFYDVISGKVPVSVFRNNIVLVSDYIDENNTFKAPNQRNTMMKEIEVQANILQALMAQKTGRNISKAFLSVVYALFAGLFFIITAKNYGFKTLIASACIIIAEVAICIFLNYAGYYVLILIPIIYAIAIVTVNFAVGYYIARKNKSEIESIFKKYVDERVVNEVVNSGTIQAKIGVERKDIAVLFVDIRGFTSLSEELMPEQVVDILNSYLTLVSNAVAVNGGTLDKFIGDAAMAVFNSPSDLEDYVYKAVKAGWDILLSAETLNKKCLNTYNKEVSFGIGIHCGEAVIGNIGSNTRMDFTAIGDTVNTASRLEGIAGPGQIFISSEVKSRLEERISVSFAGNFSLKGKKENVSIYLVEGINEDKANENSISTNNIKTKVLQTVSEKGGIDE